MKIFREEVFGGVLFDTDSLRYDLLAYRDNVHFDRFLPLQSVPPRSDILTSPIRVYFEITRKCNLHCRHCFASSSITENVFLNTEDILSTLKEMQSFRVLDIRFTGGEPTCHEDWFDVLNYAKKLGFAISVNTNGVYRNQKEVLEKFLIVQPNQITLSIDGLEQNHDYIRGKNSFRATFETLLAFSKVGLPLRVNTVITKKNYFEIPQLLELVAPFIKEINFFYMRPVGRALSLFDFSLSFEEHLKSAMDTISLREKFPEVNIMHFEQSYRDRSISEDTAQALDLKPSLPYGGSTLSISCNGTVWPHGYSPYQDEKLMAGDLKLTSLEKIWNESAQLNRFRDWMVELMKICTTCPFYQNQQCAGVNFEMEIAKQNGDTPQNPFCKRDFEFPKFN